MAERSNGKGPRAARRVEAEHRRLESLFRRTRRALVPPCAPAEAEEAFGRLRREVDGHLAQEDSLYYPPLWALRPEYKDALQQLVGAHDAFRRRLAEIAADLMRGAVAPALAGFDAFVEDFGRHELREERLLARIAR
ncbi:MAG TPA: hemerythrin domain-containing protein [Candidatus Binatia bacterium]|nr:hemerythrin domain-containing protein [Candidatus Binatia bacterium]